MFFVIGTAMATRIPVVGMTPLKSLEQMGPMGVFWWLQLLELCRVLGAIRGLDEEKFKKFRQQVFLACGAVGIVVVSVLFQLGHFGPISSRVRGLFVQHTRTGNPLVDSVAEHQATSPKAYWQYLHYMCYVAPIGFGQLITKRTSAQTFLVLYAAVAYYFSSKMNRLVLLLGPVGAALGGVAVANMTKWALGQLWDAFTSDADVGSASGKEGGKKAKVGCHWRD